MKRYDGVIFDLDGCVYIGDKPTEGAVEALAKLKKLGVKILYLTNNSGWTSEDYAMRLRRMGIECSADEVLTVGEVIASYILSKSGPSKVLVIAGRGVKEYCKRLGHKVLEPQEWREAEYVVVGLDPEINYKKIRFGLKAILKGAVFIGTNPDVTHPGSEGIEPGSGAMIAAFKAMTGIEPIIMGKPFRIIMDAALDRLKLTADRVLVVGDRLDTDVKAGKTIGADTALVLTGITKESDLENVPPELKPTYVFRNLHELVHKLYEE